MTALTGEQIDPEEIKVIGTPDEFSGLEWLRWGETARVSQDMLGEASRVSVLSGNISDNPELLRRTLHASGIRLSRHPDAEALWLNAQRELARARVCRLREALGATVGLVTTSTYSLSPRTHERRPLTVLQAPGVALMTPASDYPVVSLAFSHTPSKRPAISQVEVTPGMVYDNYLQAELEQLAARGVDLETAVAHVGPYAHPDPLRELHARYPSNMHNLGLSIGHQLAESGIGTVRIDLNDVRMDKSRYSDRRLPILGAFGRTATAICIVSPGIRAAS